MHRPQAESQLQTQISRDRYWANLALQLAQGHSCAAGNLMPSLGAQTLVRASSLQLLSRVHRKQCHKRYGIEFALLQSTFIGALYLQIIRWFEGLNGAVCQLDGRSNRQRHLSTYGTARRYWRGHPPAMQKLGVAFTDGQAR